MEILYLLENLQGGKFRFTPCKVQVCWATNRELQHVAQPHANLQIDSSFFRLQSGGHGFLPDSCQSPPPRDPKIASTSPNEPAHGRQPISKTLAPPLHSSPEIPSADQRSERISLSAQACVPQTKPHAYKDLAQSHRSSRTALKHALHSLEQTRTARPSHSQTCAGNVSQNWSAQAPLSHNIHHDSVYSRICTNLEPSSTCLVLCNRRPSKV